MAHTVQEIMNRELLSIGPDHPAREASEVLRSFHVTALPVIDEERRPLGVVSRSDPLELEGTVGTHMTQPAACIPVSMTVEEAGRQLATRDLHHLVVVDGAGKAVGMLSTLDVLRALLDIPTRHPDTFPHWDETTGVSWTNDWRLQADSIDQAPSKPGVLLLSAARHGERDAAVWVESCADVRSRVGQLVARAVVEDAALECLLAHGDLRFRAAAIVDQDARERTTALLRDRIAHVPPPGGT